MYINPSGENYLETILILSKKTSCCSFWDIATELDFKKAQRKCSMKKLRTRTYHSISGRIYQFN